MRRALLATAALSLLLGAPALAQETEGEAAPAVEDPAATIAEPAEPVEPQLPPVTSVELAGMTAEELIGIDVRNTSDESLGSIKDAKLDGDGKIDTLIVAFGGFLGFGEKTVELGLDQVEIMGRGGEEPYHAVTDVTPEELESMPQFES